MDGFFFQVMLQNDAVLGGEEGGRDIDDAGAERKGVVFQAGVRFYRFEGVLAQKPGGPDVPYSPRQGVARQLAAGRSMCSTVYTDNVSCCRFSSRPSFRRTSKMVGRPANGFTAVAVVLGAEGRRMGTQPSVFTVNSPLSAERFTTGKPVQLAM